MREALCSVLSLATRDEVEISIMNIFGMYLRIRGFIIIWYNDPQHYELGLVSENLEK
jgi:hypothetical protein